MSGPKTYLTGRGFTVYDEFEDRYGSTVRVQQSSLAMEPAVWVFTERHDGSPGGAIHLTVAQSVRLRAALEAWEADVDAGLA